jgi:hypothetical protein
MVQAWAPSPSISWIGSRPDATLVTIDLNDDFTRYISRKFTDSR